MIKKITPRFFWIFILLPIINNIPGFIIAVFNSHEYVTFTHALISDSKVLIFCVEFRELSHLTRDLSQAEKKITVLTSWATDKMTTSNHFEWNWDKEQQSKAQDFDSKYRQMALTGFDT